MKESGKEALTKLTRFQERQGLVTVALLRQEHKVETDNMGSETFLVSEGNHAIVRDCPKWHSVYFHNGENLNELQKPYLYHREIADENSGLRKLPPSRFLTEGFNLG